jgi:hypothetical protein
MSTLRVAVDYNVCAGALCVECSDLSNTVAASLGDLFAVWSAESGIELNVDVVAALALGSELAAASLEDGGDAAISVACVVAAGHEDDHILTGCVKLGRVGALCSSKGGEGTKGQCVAKAERHDYGLGLGIGKMPRNSDGDMERKANVRILYQNEEIRGSVVINRGIIFNTAYLADPYEL